MGYQHERCSYCQRPYTPAEIEARKVERQANMAASRAKARANGTPLGRKKRGDTALILKLRAEGYSIRGIAQLAQVSTTAVQRRLREAKP